MAKKNPYGGKSPNPLAKLERRSDVTTRSLARELRSRLASIRARIVATKDPAYAKSQEELFDAIARSLERFGKSLDRHLKDDVVSAATDAARRAEDEAGALVRWDEARLKRYWRYVAPQQGKNLAAVFTDKMSEDLITSLRQSLVEVEREAVIEGWTMNEKQKAVQDRWAELARDDSAFKFVDRSGKTWDNARYLQMLTRTTSQRVYNDALADRFAEDGDRYARITSMGTPGCKACVAWQGQIVVLAGKSRQFPTLAEARAAGVFHPNCLCTLEYIDEDLDADEIGRQRDAGKVDWTDADAVQKRADEIAVRGLRDEGMSEDEAEDALTRRKLEDALRSGLFTDDAKALADGFTRERLAELRKNGVPRFEFTKKGDKVGWHHGSAGGVVRIDRNDLAGGLKEVFGTEDDVISSRKVVSQAEEGVALANAYHSTLEHITDKRDDEALSKALADVGERIRTEKKEHMVVLNPDGSLRFDEFVSTETGGRIPPQWVGKLKGATLTHNHPELGGGLSSDDIYTARAQGLRTIRASSATADYTLTVDEWPSREELKKAMEEADREVTVELSKSSLSLVERMLVVQDKMVERLAQKLNFRYDTLRR